MNKQKGFTLIELLTVMLIIGILSSVAIPQYRKVVEKARFTKVEVMANGLYESCERLLAEYGKDKYANLPNEDAKKLTRLDIGENELLPKGFTLKMEGADATAIQGAGFEFTLTDTDEKDGCSVLMNKVSGRYKDVQIIYDGNEFTCSGNDTACEIYGLD